MGLGEEIRFGAFTLHPGRRELLNGGAPVRIGQRALDLLVALAGQPGEVVEHAALQRVVWPGRHVEESNLRAQMSALRRALGESEADARHIVTVPGRGYSLAVPLEAASLQRGTRPEPSPTTLPVRLQTVLGREDDIALVATRLVECRFVSIVGAGGIGKTTVALSVAARLDGGFDVPPLFIDLGPLSDGALAADQLRVALEAEGRGGGLASLARSRRLIILDSCEPVIEAAAALAEQILRTGPGLHVLATSREPLRAEGEWTYRLPSMESPPIGTDLTVSTALGFPAIALFVERMQAAGAAPVLTDADVCLMAQICRQLDGIPLAIELAATRATQLGLQALAERLNDRFRLLLQGRRTALPRHQTLRATLDWSHSLLPTAEQRLLRRLSVFAGCFSLEAALAIGGEPGDDDDAPLVDRIGRLADKSFLTLQPRSGAAAYRCPDTTRLYLAGKLEEAGETPAVALRHARYYRALFSAAEAQWAGMPVAAARARLAPDIDNLRVALDWALAPGGDTEMGMALTLSAVPLWSALGMIDEARRRLDDAIAAFRSAPRPDPRQGMMLHASAGTIAMFYAGAVEQAWAETLRLAEELGDTEHQLRALNGLMPPAGQRDHREALAVAQRFHGLAWQAGEPDDGPVGDRLLGLVRHMLGEQAEARRLTEAMLARYPRRVLQPHQNKLNFYDQRILAQATLARILWLQGESAAGLAMADATVAEAQALGHPFSLLYVLIEAAAPLAFLAGDPHRATQARLTMQQELPQFANWVLWQQSFLALEMMAEGQPDEGLRLLLDRMAEMPLSSLSRRAPLLHAGITQALLALGRPDEAMTRLEGALSEARRRHEGWFEPEYLRLRGECLMALDRAEEAARDHAAAVALAERQSALAWSLRAATSLARLRPTTMPRLADIVARFPTAADTPDLRAARRMLADR